MQISNHPLSLYFTSQALTATSNVGASRDGTTSSPAPGVQGTGRTLDEKVYQGEVLENDFSGSGRGGDTYYRGGHTYTAVSGRPQSSESALDVYQETEQETAIQHRRLLDVYV